MTEAQKGEVLALQDLLSSDGWRVFTDMVWAEIASDFEEHITKALDVPDAVVALDRMRQVAAVRKAGQRWLGLPKKRIDTLMQLEDQQRQVATVSRRPAGL